MAPSRILWPALAFVTALARSDDASACSCIGPQDAIVLAGLTGAPLNAHVRVEVADAKSPLLRTQGGADVPTTSRSWKDGWLTYVELVPTQPLQANTLYEVVIADPSQVPSTVVLGSITTGTASDTTAPTLDATGTARAEIKLQPHGSMCQTDRPHIDVGPLKATDVGRPNAQFLYAVWAPDAAGKLDTSRRPDALLEPDSNGSITIGKTSSCDPHDVALPSTGAMTVAIAAVDEAGNRSAPKKLRVFLQSMP